MEDLKVIGFVKSVLENMPSDWLRLTTHRLDIYEEKLAKTQFLERFESLYYQNSADTESLSELPTAFDYIRLGHPLSCVLEWAVAKLNGLNADQVISFASKTTPILAILRKNLLQHKSTQIVYSGDLPDCFDAEKIKTVYGYQFELVQSNDLDSLDSFDGSRILLHKSDDIGMLIVNELIDFCINIHDQYGSIIGVVNTENDAYIAEIQHVRRRETIAMTPANCAAVLKTITRADISIEPVSSLEDNKAKVAGTIKSITNSNTEAIVGSSGLSVQYAIMMGLVDHALEQHPGKSIHFVVPPNCYGGTNDQARRVAACLSNVTVEDLPVDGGKNMVQSIDTVLDQIAKVDGVPFIIAEIPTNPRVEVPDLDKLKEVLSAVRITEGGTTAVDPVFILDQTFCPDVRFLGAGDILSGLRSISYVSGSKFPSGGRCTAGYCVGSDKAAGLMQKIAHHMSICDNEATPLQYEILAEQMPSMNQRIQDAYLNTRDFVTFIEKTLPAAKINFVSEELAQQGFKPSVFSLDLPTKGGSDEEKEAHKRALNDLLIKMMIGEIPEESKFCVSYGQLKGCYWTIPATSTQGTTKEGDKDYIVRVALSPNLDLNRHKKVFLEFVETL